MDIEASEPWAENGQTIQSAEGEETIRVVIGDARGERSNWRVVSWVSSSDSIQVAKYHQSENHASTPPFSFLQARCPSCRPTNSVKAIIENDDYYVATYNSRTNNNSNVYSEWKALRRNEIISDNIEGVSSRFFDEVNISSPVL